MPASIVTPADVVNLALVRIGHPLRVGSLYDGSPAAKKALDIYAQTRDELLVELEPDFAQRDLTLTLLKTAPAGGYVPPVVWSAALHPPVPYIFEYQFPADALKIRALKRAPLFIPNFMPVPAPFSIANDNALAPPQKVVLCYLAGAIAVYTGQVTDPTTWKPTFTEALAAALARRLTVALADPRLLEAEAKDEQVEMVAGSMQQG